MKFKLFILILFLAISCTTEAQEPIPRITFIFIPNEYEKSVLNVDDLSRILPNFPDAVKRKETPEYNWLSVEKVVNLLPGATYYVICYKIPKSICSEYGVTFCIITIKNGKPTLVYKSRSFMDEGVDKARFVDFDNDGYIDIFLPYGREGYISSYALYRNIKGSFRDDVIYFTNYYTIENEFLPMSEGYKTFGLIDIDKDRKYELIVESDKFKRIYKWNGEVYVLQSKKPVANIKK